MLVAGPTALVRMACQKAKDMDSDVLENHIKLFTPGKVPSFDFVNGTYGESGFRIVLYVSHPSERGVHHEGDRYRRTQS